MAHAHQPRQPARRVPRPQSLRAAAAPVGGTFPSARARGEGVRDLHARSRRSRLDLELRAQSASRGIAPTRSSACTSRASSLPKIWPKAKPARELAQLCATAKSRARVGACARTARDSGRASVLTALYDEDRPPARIRQGHPRHVRSQAAGSAGGGRAPHAPFPRHARPRAAQSARADTQCGGRHAPRPGSTTSNCAPPRHRRAPARTSVAAGGRPLRRQPDHQRQGGAADASLSTSPRP